MESKTMNYQRMIELKRSMQELIVAESLDMARVQAEHAEFVALRAEHRAEVAQQEAERQARLARGKAIRDERRAAAEKMKKAELQQATGITSPNCTREYLITVYESMGALI